jgi:hypothetical protein
VDLEADFMVMSLLVFCHCNNMHLRCQKNVCFDAMLKDKSWLTTSPFSCKE